MYKILTENFKHFAFTKIAIERVKCQTYSMEDYKKRVFERLQFRFERI